jgi:hypothetical protein
MKNYLAEMLDALTSPYTRKDYTNSQRGSPLETNIGRLFSIFAWGLELTGGQAELIKKWDDIDYAKGSVLDRYGANFGVKRNGARDSYYRLLIKVKMLSLLSGGDIDTIINAAASLFDLPTEKIRLKEIFPAKVGVDINEADLTPEALDMVEDIAAMLKRILAAGVGLITTLYSYRDFEQTTVISGALFEGTGLVFQPPPGKPQRLGQKISVASAAFESTRLLFGLSPSARRTFSRTLSAGCALFERSRVTVVPVYQGGGG